MMTTKEIIARLNDGETIDSIAADFADLLNAANAEYIKSTAERQKQEQKVALATQMNDILIAYAELVNPEVAPFMKEAADDSDIDVLIDSMDNMFELVAAASTLKASLTPLSVSMGNAKAPTNDDDVLSNFISKICQ